MLSQVSARIRRSAGRLPEDSPLRAELLETAEYFELGIDPESCGDAGQRSRVG